MAWASEASLGAAQTAINNTWTDLVAAAFTTANPYDVYHIQINADNNSGTVTDSLQTRVLTYAGTQYDTVPAFSASLLPTVVTDEFMSFSFSGFYQFKVQVRSSGSTDTYDVTASKARVFTN